MTLRIEPFDIKDCDQVIDVWNASQPYDQTTHDKLMDWMTHDPNYTNDAFKVAWIQNRIVGFILGVIRQESPAVRDAKTGHAYIRIMGVDPKYQSQGIGSKLVEAFEKECGHHGITHITLCAYSPYYITPGIDTRYRHALSMFEKHGYTFTSESVSMKRDLTDFNLHEGIKKRQACLKEEGITLGPYTDACRDELIQFVTHTFSSGWVSNVNKRIQENDADQTIIIARNKTEIIGFCMRKMDGNDARFGPMGVDPKTRGKGIGGILLELMLESMKKQKILTPYFLWTSGTNIAFYRNHGFTIVRTYNMGGKNLIGCVKGLG